MGAKQMPPRPTPVGRGRPNFCESPALSRRCIPQLWRRQMNHRQQHHARSLGAAWNAGRSVGPKRALKPQQVWEIRVHLEHENRTRDRAMFDIAIDSKLRACDLVKLRIGDVVVGGQVRQRSMVVQQKTGTPVSFEIGDTARESLRRWLLTAGPAGLRTSCFRAV